MVRMHVLTIIILMFTVRHVLCKSAEPTDCISSSNSIGSLIDCIDPFIIPENMITYDDWLEEVKPKDQLREEFVQVVKLLLDQQIDCNISSAMLPYLAVAGPMELFLFEDNVYNTNHCVLMERSMREYDLPDGTTQIYFYYGLGVFITPAKGSQIRFPGVHFSAAHPQTDGPVHQQAMNLYARLGVKSVMITGATRKAVDPDHAGDCQSHYRIIDASHSNETLFHAALLETLRWQTSSAEGGSCKWTLDKPTQNCLFVQFHGMRDISCKDDVTIFMSVGGKRDAGAKFYNDPNAAINLLDNALELVLPNNWGIHTTSQTNNCNLVAATNVFGRVVNGVPIGQECGTYAVSDGFTGAFIHIEQKKSVSSQTDYNAWQRAFENVLTTVRVRNKEDDTADNYQEAAENNSMSQNKLENFIVIIFSLLYIFFRCQ